MIFKKDKFVIVIGCGRFGSSIAGILSGAGNDVVLVDKCKESFRKLPAVFSGFTVEGDACDESVLREAGIERADVVIVCTENDNVNVMVCQMAAKNFGVAEVFVRLYDPDKEAILAGYNVTKIYPVLLSLKEFERIAKLKTAKEEKEETASGGKKEKP
jgi:trk system potassium uptake protein TrkA